MFEAMKFRGVSSLSRRTKNKASVAAIIQKEKEPRGTKKYKEISCQLEVDWEGKELA